MSFGDLIRKRKDRKERAKQGWSDSDVWDFDVWFLRTVHAMLDRFREISISIPSSIMKDVFDERKEEFGLEDVDFPVWPNDEEKREKMKTIESEARRRWHNVLEMTATLLRRAEKEWDDGNYEAMREPKNEAFALLSKWFFDLWT